MNIFKRTSALNMLLILALQLMAQGPNDSGTYYQSANGKKGSALKTAMSDIIVNHTQLSYDDIWDAFYETDKRENGKVWDMYSTSDFVFGTDQDRGNGSKEGEFYNREHSMPKSWFNDKKPMYTDLMHLVPTDKYVNSRRSNYPFGETTNPSYTSNGGFSKLGPSSVSGYTGTVFEPNDEYKGDFARIYFYMATCYEDQISDWTIINGEQNKGTIHSEASDVFAGNSYPAYTQWTLNLLLRWAAEDPISKKEIDRNNAVYEWQGNRNPYVDYPGLEQYVWGEYKDKAFSYDNYEEPDITGDPDDPIDPPVSDSRTFTKVTSQSQLSPEYTYLIVCEESNMAMGATEKTTEKTYRSPINVTLSGNTITTDVNGNGQPRAFNLGGTAGAYTLYDGVEDVYLALNSSDNALHGTTTTTTDNAKWTITISGNSTIQNNAYTDRYINYNTTAKHFACYKTASNQKPVALYRSTTTTGITEVEADGNENVDVYTITGMKVRSQVTRDDALDGLEKGVYIIGNKKYLVR